MKLLIIIPLIFVSTLAHGQLAPNIKCYPSNWTFYYFAYKAKYQVSSEGLVAQANQQLSTTTKNLNGFVTVRFLVNCKAERSSYEVLSIAPNYEPVSIASEASNAVLAFVKSLNHWPAAGSNNSNPRDYQAFISFKFYNGKITEITP